MDYIKIPRSLIYKDRDDLKDFGVLTPDTMNYLLFLRLKQQALMGVPGARDVALRCYNNAYYVCTLILLEANDFPELRISDYVDKILEIEKGKGHVDEVCLASMAMACLLLAKYDKKKYGRDSDVWNNIYYRCTHYQWYNSQANTIFLNMMSCEYNITSPLSHTEFAPRDIIEVIEDFSERDLQDYAEYICERLALLEDSRLRVYETDLAIARIKGYQRDFCEDYEYNPKKDCIKYEDDDNSLRDSKIEDMVRRHYQQSKEAIQYYKEHYPQKEENDSKEKTADFPHAPETGVHQKEMAEMESKLTHQVGELQKKLTDKSQDLQEALQIIEEYRQPVKELTAKQKIRMEFALQLLLEAGLTEENLDKENRNKSKVASLLSLLLGISSNVCANYLVDRNYYPQEKDRETILELDKLCLELGIRAHLNTKQRGNKKS